MDRPGFSGVQVDGGRSGLPSDCLRYRVHPLREEVDLTGSGRQPRGRGHIKHVSLERNAPVSPLPTGVGDGGVGPPFGHEREHCPIDGGALLTVPSLPPLG